mgnify:CR=1 FL=1
MESIPGFFFIDFFPRRSSSNNKNGRFKFGHGHGSELFKMHISRSERDFRQCKKRNVFYENSNTIFGYFVHGRNILNEVKRIEGESIYYYYYYHLSHLKHLSCQNVTTHKKKNLELVFIFF